MRVLFMALVILVSSPAMADGLYKLGKEPTAPAMTETDFWCSKGWAQTVEEKALAKTYCETASEGVLNLRSDPTKTEAVDR
jgi:hypothetical protein